MRVGQIDGTAVGNVVGAVDGDAVGLMVGYGLAEIGIVYAADAVVNVYWAIVAPEM